MWSRVSSSAALQQGEKQGNQAQKISLQQQFIARCGGVVQGIHIVEQIV